MKRLVIVIFVIVATALALVFFMGKPQDSATRRVATSQTVIPKTASQAQASAEVNADEADTSLVSLIPLYDDETLMGTLSIDFDGDGYDDQINTIRRISDPYIQIIVGLYNPYKGQYERSAVINTEVIQTRTFSYTCMDLIGNHQNVLMYSGFVEGGDSVMKLFLPERQDTGLVMHTIGDFRADGTIYVQQIDRHESYQSQKANGTSFPVWVHRSDSSAGSGRLDQIQTKYVWDVSSGRYVQDTETRVQESHVTTRELNRILDGTETTLKAHLEGLWYSANSSGSQPRFMFFNPREEEIIFQADESQEVYTWISSTLRRSGIYITAINTSINNLTRRIDISLTGVDEIQVRNQDDVLMTISERSAWDGEYRKQPTSIAKKPPQPQEVLQLLEGQRHWLVEGVTEMEIIGGTYSSPMVKGMITSTFCDGQEVLQVRGSVGAPFYNQETYLATVRHNRDTKLVESVRLAPVKITPLGLEALGGSQIRLEANYNTQKDPAVQVTTPDEPELQATSVHDGEDQASRPQLSVHTSPRYFSPDNDGIDDKLSIDLGVTSETPVASWSFNIYDPANNSLIWSRSGLGEVTKKLEWNGRSNAGELVQSATDYPFVFSAKDENGMSSEARGELSVDVLVIHEGSVLKIQVPSIIFRSDKADFVGLEEDPEKGLDRATIDNNIKVIQRIAQILNKFPDYSVRIEGHANNITGTEAEETSTANGNIPLVPLSEERADLVRDMLISFGVNGSRLSTVGMGGRQPVVPRADRANWWKNRRVEFILDK